MSIEFDFSTWNFILLHTESGTVHVVALIYLVFLYLGIPIALLVSLLAYLFLDHRPVLRKTLIALSILIAMNSVYAFVQKFGGYAERGRQEKTK